MCCHFTNLDECVTLQPRSPLFSCGSLMQNTFLRISMWVLGISAVLGNALVIVSRCVEKPKRKNEKVAIQSFFIMNLAFSDFQMGVYMLIIASVDLYYGEEYFLFSEAWQSSTVCKVAGFISLLSSEASVCFLTLITIERFLSLVLPFGKFHFTISSARVAVIIVWTTIGSLSLSANILADVDSDFYGLSDVCIGLPLITRPTSYALIEGAVGNQLSGNTFNIPVPEDTKSAWIFSIVLFLGVNSVLFFVVFVCYVVIFVVIIQSRKKVRSSRVNNDDEIKMALKMVVLVGTDFFCWMPIVISGIVSQTGLAVIPLSMYVWTVVFILPINSAVNPYLYTLSTYIAARMDQKKERSVKPGGSRTKTSKL